MRLFPSILVAVMLMPGPAAHAQSAESGERQGVAKPAARPGKWWASADTDRRDGFFWGAGDCLGAEAHIPHGFFGTSRGFNSDAFDKEVSRYYADHPADSKLPVIEVWRKVGRQIARDTPQTKGGEIYSNPHGFLDGLWYRQGSYSDRLGFLE